MKAGIWWPGRGLIGVEEWRRVVLDMSSGAGMVAEEGFESPTVAISFYRALVQSGETGPIEALVEALAGLGLRPLPVFAYSLKDPISTGILESVFSALKPDVVINTTGFAVSAPGADRQPTVLEANEAIVLQAILSASSKEAWAASPQGLSARDLGMNVALPEVDGRVLARAVSFKTAARYDALVETNIVASQADA